jgi:hypothetical protein
MHALGLQFNVGTRLAQGCVKNRPLALVECAAKTINTVAKIRQVCCLYAFVNGG